LNTKHNKQMHKKYKVGLLWQLCQMMYWYYKQKLSYSYDFYVVML